MRVLVDLLYFTGTKGGMESYVRELYPRMPSDTEYVGFGSKQVATMPTPWFPGTIVDSGIDGDSRAGWAVGELTAVGRAATRVGADLIHSPANIGPWRSRTPLVLNLHDLLPFRNPEFVPGPYAPLLRRLEAGAGHHARRVLTLSEASRADVEHFLHIPPDRIDVIPLAGGHATVTSTLTRQRDLLVAVGNRLPHKNFERLVRALALIPAEHRPRLVITGSVGQDPLAPLVAELGLQSWVGLRGWITAKELEDLFASATAVVVPTLFEGFGLPVLEGMGRGCAVLCSDIPVLHEVAGGAAAYFDPLDVESIATTIRSTLADDAELTRLTAAGIERARGFSWERTARLTADAFKLAVG